MILTFPGIPTNVYLCVIDIPLLNVRLPSVMRVLHEFDLLVVTRNHKLPHNHESNVQYAFQYVCYSYRQSIHKCGRALCLRSFFYTITELKLFFMVVQNPKS